MRAQLVQKKIAAVKSIQPVLRVFMVWASCLQAQFACPVAGI